MADPGFSLAIRLVILTIAFVLFAWGSYRAVILARETALVRRKVRSVAMIRSMRDESIRSDTGTAWVRLVELAESSGLSLTDSNPDALRAKMIAAGFDSPEAPRVYTLARLVTVIALPIGGIALLVLSGQTTFASLYFVGILTAGLGLLGPTFYLRSRTNRRKTALINGFPNCLDLLLVCVEAGLALEAALDRISREMAEAEPEVTQLLVRTTLHLRAGASREEALRRLGELAGVDEIRSFCALLIQSERLGSSIATTLRIFATEMREKRRMRAEEKAHKLPVLISVPLIVCMLPTMLGVLMLPALIRVMRDLLPAMAGN